MTETQKICEAHLFSKRSSRRCRKTGFPLSDIILITEMTALKYSEMLIVSLAVHQMSLVYCWMDAPYNNDQFNYKQKYGENVTIRCWDERLPDSYTFQYWIRPDLVVMRSLDSDHFWTLDGDAGWTVSSDGLLMHVTNLNQRQFGFYYCVVQANGTTYVVKRAVNYQGPYFGNLWPKYRMNVIVGLCAAAVFLVLSLGACLIAEYVTRKQAKAKAEPRSDVRRSRRRDSEMSESGENYVLKRRTCSEGEGQCEEVRL